MTRRFAFVVIVSLLMAPTFVASADDDEIELEGVITAFGANGFDLDEDGDVYEVVVTPDTDFEGVGGLDDLRVDDLVKVKGIVDGSRVVADEVKLEEADEGIEFSYEGLLIDLDPPDRFEMDDGRSYMVDQDTEYEEIGSYDDLVVGQILDVKAVRTPSGSNLARRVKLEGEEEDDGYNEIEGVVAAVSEFSLVFTSGTTVILTPSTVFNGDADVWSDIEAGWDAEVLAYADLTGDLVAVEVRAEDPDPSTVGGEDFEPQQALAVLVAGADPNAVASRHGAEVVGLVGELAVLLWWPDEIDDELLASLNADADVRAVEPNYLFRDPETVRRRYPIVDLTPTTSEYVSQDAAFVTNLWPARSLADGSGTVVAVVDTGVDPDHPALQGRIVAGGLDLVDGDSEPWEERNGTDDDGDGDIDEATGHGSFVASIVALGAPGAGILPYRVLDDDGDGTAYWLSVALADAISRGVDVINLSLVYRSRSTAVDLLLEEASALGIIVVCSAGNDSSAVLPFPASDSHVVAVTALQMNGSSLADFANRSEVVMIAAPGVEVYGALDQQAFGISSGTSMAAPFVSASAAQLKSLDPGLDPALIVAAIMQGGVPIADGQWSGVALDMEAALRLVDPSPRLWRPAEFVD